ncbi:MAG TPA: glycoside hydrolase family 3 N-terminal domain-containing protein [Thermoanaerobaculia bacterium]|nr:glycoside hydrolase family 3 N-terminal domain-containing protein [Thermoanaerobaculia bacterium]
MLILSLLLAAVMQRTDAHAIEMHRAFLERGKQPVGVLFVGDSITEGWSSHPALWKERFGSYEPANFGIGGDKTEHVLWRIEEGGELDAVKPRLVVLLIGTNNIGDPADGIAAGVTKIVSDIHAKLPSSNLLLLGIFPRADDREGKVAAVNRSLAQLVDAHTQFLDIGAKFDATSKEIMPDGLHLSEAGYRIWADAIQSAVDNAMGGATVHPEIWPKVVTPARNPQIEKKVDALVRKMTVEEKVAQCIQPSIAYVTPDEVRQYHFGSVLNGGGGWPIDIRKVRINDWVTKADAFYAASMDTSGGKQAIPIIWGADAVHGHNNVVGATLFPQNIGLGATNDAELVEKIGAVVADEMRVTGIDWNFFPTVAAVQDIRWGRTYESYSDNPQLVAKLAASYIKGLQSHGIMATAKHYIGDGGTVGGKDQGDNVSTETELRDIHGAGYAAALKEHVDTVMASYSSWHGVKMHGNKALLTDVLKDRMRFDGFVVGDWNGHAQVPGCTNDDCAQAFNAGVDMFMVPQDWKALYEHTLGEVKSGVIPMTRLDDAVRRILRVKYRTGLFAAGKPSSRPLAGKVTLVGWHSHRAVARRAVRESLVLLKNNRNTLPLSATAKVLVAGDGADNIPKQTGGWTLSWQGDGNTNADFPGATSIWAGIREHAPNAKLSVDGSFTEKPDVAIVVYGENPYAEMIGDRQTLVYSDAPHLAMLQKFKDAGVPVVSVFISGRPLSVNRFLNASNAFVAAWLPGTEGGGIADVLFGAAQFHGKLPFEWPGYGRELKSPGNLPEEKDDAANAAHTFKVDTTGGAVTITPNEDLSRETNAGLALIFDYFTGPDTPHLTFNTPLRCLGKPPYRIAVAATSVENIRLAPGAEGPGP